MREPLTAMPADIAQQVLTAERRAKLVKMARAGHDYWLFHGSPRPRSDRHTTRWLSPLCR